MNYSPTNIDIDNAQPQNPNIGEISGGENTKMFTKEQVNKIVEERLKKERIKFGALKDLKDAVMNLYERGYFDKYKDALGKNLSLSDMAGIVLEEIEKAKPTEQTAQVNNLEQSAKSEELEVSSETIPADAKMPPEWSVNPRIFEMFAENKNLPIEQILNEYLKFVVKVEQASKASIDSTVRQVLRVEQNQFNSNQTGANSVNEVEGTNSENALTANYGAGNASDNFYNNREQILGTKNQNNIKSEYTSIPTAQGYRTGDNFTLTERQKELARAGGMTYREYNEFYNSIPTKKLKR